MKAIPGRDSVSCTACSIRQNLVKSISEIQLVVRRLSNETGFEKQGGLVPAGRRSSVLGDVGTSIFR